MSSYRFKKALNIMKLPNHLRKVKTYRHMKSYLLFKDGSSKDSQWAKQLNPRDPFLKTKTSDEVTVHNMTATVTVQFTPALKTFNNYTT